MSSYLVSTQARPQWRTWSTVCCAVRQYVLKHYEMSIEKLAICHKAKSWKKPYEAEARIFATVGKIMKHYENTLEKYDMQYVI